jgi:hypothetical protein
MNNTKQLALAWHLYAGDFDDRLVYNRDGGNAGKAAGNESWVGGWLDLQTSTLDNTNTLYLTFHDDTSGNKYSYCGYLGSGICPPLLEGQNLSLGIDLPGDQDVQWLQQRAAGAANYP